MSSVANNQIPSSKDHWIKVLNEFERNPSFNIAISDDSKRIDFFARVLVLAKEKSNLVFLEKGIPCKYQGSDNISSCIRNTCRFAHSDLMCLAAQMVYEGEESKLTALKMDNLYRTASGHMTNDIHNARSSFVAHAVIGSIFNNK